MVDFNNSGFSEEQTSYLSGFVSGILQARELPFLGQDFFPVVDAGQIRLHLRAPIGTRVEETARLVAEVEASIRFLASPDAKGIDVAAKRARFERAERVMARIREMRGGADNSSKFGERMTGSGIWAPPSGLSAASRVSRNRVGEPSGTNRPSVDTGADGPVIVPTRSMTRWPPLWLPGMRWWPSRPRTRRCRHCDWRRSAAKPACLMACSTSSLAVMRSVLG